MNNGYFPIDANGLREAYLESSRGFLADHYARRLTDDQIAGVLRDAMESMSDMEREAFAAISLQKTIADHAEDFGSFIKSVGGIAKKALPVVAPILQTAAPLVGTTFGGPVGGMIGTQVGNLLGNYAGTPAPKATRNMPAAAPPAQAPGMRPALSPATPKPVVDVNPFASQLMALLSNPQLLQAVMGQTLGNVGNGNASVQLQNSVETIPFGAMMNTLSELAQRAAEESLRTGSMESENYLTDNYGNYRIGDPSNPEERADAVMELLREDYRWRNGISSEEEENYIENHDKALDPLTEWLVSAGMVR